MFVARDGEFSKLPNEASHQSCQQTASDKLLQLCNDMDAIDFCCKHAHSVAVYTSAGSELPSQIDPRGQKQKLTRRPGYPTPKVDVWRLRRLLPLSGTTLEDRATFQVEGGRNV